jgi:uncharacterized repeat protein (TIGR02543 family)
MRTEENEMRKKKFSLVLSVMLAITLVFTRAPTNVPEASAATDTTVYVTWQSEDSGFAFAKQPVNIQPGLAKKYGYSYGSNVKATDITALDALVAAHSYYLDGDMTDIADNLVLTNYGESAFVTEWFDVPASNSLTFVNGEQAHNSTVSYDSYNGVSAYGGLGVNQAVIKKGDSVTFYNLQDNSTYLDYNTWFEKDGAKTSRLVVTPGESINLLLKGYMGFAYGLAVPGDMTKNTKLISCADFVPVEINTEGGWNVGLFKDKLLTTEADGKISFAAPAVKGTSYYSATAPEGATDSEVPIVSPWLEVKVASKHTVAFNANGGKLSGAASKSVFETEPYGALPAATRTGYTFAGWYTAAMGGGKVADSTIVTATSGETLYAHWTANNYTAKFKANGGKASKASKKITYATKHGTLPTATRAGYTFAGWYTKSSKGTKITANTKVTAAKNITLYAHWTAKKYTVKFNANGGKVSKASKRVTFGAKYGALPTPKKANKSFAGWYTKRSGGAKITSTKKVGSAKNITLYAHWKAEK